MKVEMKIIGRSLISPLQGGIYELEKGATIADLMRASAQKYGEIEDKNASWLTTYLLNNRPVQDNAKLNDGDNVKVMTKIFGG